jgi:hypothetical protein
MSVGWWRRNRWGLILLLPLILGLVAIDADLIYQKVWGTEHKQPLTVDENGGVTFPVDGSRLRLVDLTRVSDLTGLTSVELTLPPTVVIWRGRIEIQAPRESTIGACTVTLEDADGRIYATNPSEMRTSRVTSYGCLGDTDAGDTGPSTYVATSYFALPVDARPVALRISLPDELPRYVRLAVPS